MTRPPKPLAEVTAPAELRCSAVWPLSERADPLTPLRPLGATCAAAGQATIISSPRFDPHGPAGWPPEMPAPQMGNSSLGEADRLPQAYGGRRWTRDCQPGRLTPGLRTVHSATIGTKLRPCAFSATRASDGRSKRPWTDPRPDAILRQAPRSPLCGSHRRKRVLTKDGERGRRFDGDSLTQCFRFASSAYGAAKGIGSVTRERVLYSPSA